MKSNVARRTPNRPLPRPLVHSYFSSGNAAESFCFPLPRVSRSVLDRQMSSCAADAPTTRREAFTQNSNRPLTVAELNILRKKKEKKRNPARRHLTRIWQAPENPLPQMFTIPSHYPLASSPAIFFCTLPNTALLVSDLFFFFVNDALCLPTVQGLRSPRRLKVRNRARRIAIVDFVSERNCLKRFYKHGKRNASMRNLPRQLSRQFLPAPKNASEEH